MQKRGGGNGEEKREKKELSESIEFDIFFFFALSTLRQVCQRAKRCRFFGGLFYLN